MTDLKLKCCIPWCAVVEPADPHTDHMLCREHLEQFYRMPVRGETPVEFAMRNPDLFKPVGETK